MHRSLRAPLFSALLIPFAVPVAHASAQGAPPIVTTVRAPIHTGVATLKEELSIGSLDGADEYLLGSAQNIAVAKDGTIYVFDSQVPVIRAYDASGKFLRNIGRKGQGPGEYAATSGLAVAPDGRVMQWDTGNWRVNVFTPSGDLVATWGMSGSGTASGSGGLMVDTAGLVYVRQTARPAPTPGVRARLGAGILQWVRLRDGVIVDTISTDVDQDAPRLSAVRPDGRATSSTAVPYAPRRMLAVSPLGHTVFANNATYAFEIRRPRQPAIHVQRAVAPQRVTSAERNAARTSVTENLRRTDPAWSWNGPDIPDVKPAYASMTIALDGRIWLLNATHLGDGYNRAPGSAPSFGLSGGGGGGTAGAPRPRSTAPTDPPKPTRYDVFEPDGRFLGAVELPGGVSPHVSRGDLVWDAVTGEDDVVYVKRYRINWR